MEVPWLQLYLPTNIEWNPINMASNIMIYSLDA